MHLALPRIKRRARKSKELATVADKQIVSYHNFQRKDRQRNSGQNQSTSRKVSTIL